MNSTLGRATLCLTACLPLILTHVHASNPVDAQNTEVEHTNNDSQASTASYSDSSSSASLSISIDRILRLTSPAIQEVALSQAVGELLENEAFEFVSECESISDSEQREMFLKTVFAHLTKLNIRRTLHRYETLRPSDQIAVVESIYENVETQDENYAIQSLPEFAWEIQEIALAAFLSEPRRNTEAELVAIAEIVPAMVVPLLVEIKNRDKLLDTSEKLIRIWAIKEHLVAFTLIKELHEAMPIEWLLTHTTVALSHTHPAQALHLTHDYHRDFGHQFEVEVFGHLVRNDPEAAIELLPTLRPNYVPIVSLYDLQTSLLTLGPEHVVEFGKRLSDDQSKRYFKNLRLDFCRSPPHFLVEVIDLIPFADAASAAAKCLLYQSRRNDKLTEEEFDVLYAHLLPEDRERIDRLPKTSFIREQGQ